MAKLQKHLMEFSKPDLLVAFQDYFCHYHGKTGKYDDRVSLTEKGKAIDFSVKEQIAKLSGIPTIEGIDPKVLATAPQYQWATFAVIGALVDAILPEALIDSIGLYTDIRFGGFGDSANFTITARDLFVVSKGGKGNLTTEIKKQYKGNVTLVPEFRDMTVATSLYRVLAGEENMAEFAMKAAKSLETQMTYDAYSALYTAMEALPTSGTNQLKVAGYSQSSLINLCQKVTAWNGGKQAIIVGTKSALASILPANSNFRYTLESDFVKIGYIKEFGGYAIMELPQVADYTTEFSLKLADNRLYVISPSADKLIKGFVEGSMLSLTAPYEASADLTSTTTFKKSYVFGVATNSLAGVITLS